jgi:hypothetical protein
MNQQEWIALGYELGYIGPPVCYTHDGIPTTFEEDEEFDENDPCIHIVRLYEDLDMKQGVESNHSPSKWRASSL